MDKEFVRKVIFTVAFIIVEICVAALYFWKKTDADRPPNDGSEHSVSLMQNGEFRYGLFDCLQVPSLTAFALVCCPIRWADTLRMAGFMAFWVAAAMMIALQAASPLTYGITMILALIVAVRYRQQLRGEFELASGTAWSYIEDIAAYAFCPCLAVVQEARQLEEAYAVGHPIKMVDGDDKEKA